MTKLTGFLTTTALAALIGLPAVAQEAALANITCSAFAELDDDARANALIQIGEVYMADTAETDEGIVNNQAEPAEGAEPSPEATDDPPADSMASDNSANDGTAAAEDIDADTAPDAAEPAEDLSAAITAACEGDSDAIVLEALRASTN